MKIKNKLAFTLVELLVVITILVILATTGFIAYTSHLPSVRDAARIDQLSTLRSSLETYAISDKLPTPTDSVLLQVNLNTIGTQGYAGEAVLKSINMQDGGKDPLDKTYFTYYITSNRKNFQLLTFLEKKESLDLAMTKTFAEAVDYEDRYPKVLGAKLGILTESGSNKPVQEAITTKNLDIGTTSGYYTAHFTDTKKISGNSTKLIFSNPNASCKRIKEVGNENGDGVYKINPTGTNKLTVYCDMTTDGGGWTFFGHMNSDSTGNNFFEGGVGTYKSSREDDNSKYSLGVDNFYHTEMMVTIDDKNPIVADKENKILFFRYSLGNPGFNKGPIACNGLGLGFEYKPQIGGSYVPGGTANNCNSSQWNTITAGNTNYLVLFGGGAIGNYWGSGMGGDNTLYHDGWWYLR